MESIKENEKSGWCARIRAEIQDRYAPTPRQVAHEVGPYIKLKIPCLKEAYPAQHGEASSIREHRGHAELFFAKSITRKIEAEHRPANMADGVLDCCDLP
jgi:hypothetical protein